MKLDFIIPGSPRDGFFSQIALFRLALDRLGGTYKQARLVAVFGAEKISEIPPRWAPHFRNIEVLWTDPEDFKRRSYASQGDYRFQVFRPDADLIILSDADTVIMRPFTWLIRYLVWRQSLGGVLAHYHLPWSETTGDSERDWNIISRAIIGRDISLPYRYLLQDPAESQLCRCPFYINYGFFAGPPGVLSRFYDRYSRIRPDVAAMVGPHFSGQVALALTVHELGLRKKVLPPRFNYPNYSVADTRYPADLASIVVLHYLKTRNSPPKIGEPSQFDRQSLFVSAESMAAFANLPLVGSDRVLQEFVLELTGGQYPFAPVSPQIAA